MKHLSLKIIFLAVVLPPLLYLGSVIGLERHLNDRYQKQVEKVFIGDTRPLLQGDLALKKALADHIDRFLQTTSASFWGIKIDITVNTRSGFLLYPGLAHETVTATPPPDPLAVAADNFRLLNDGLILKTSVVIPHNVTLSNMFLLFYLGAGSAAVYLYLKVAIRRLRQDELSSQNELDRLEALSNEYAGRLTDLADEKAILTEEMQRLQHRFAEERAKAVANEDQLIQDIVSLEEKINANLALHQEQMNQIQALEEKLSRVEGNRPKPKAVETVQKRFKALYKNLSFNERAITGYLELPDELKIKSEEVIHQLDQDPALVKIKRKVFGKKNREPVLEVIFGYRGRLYFSNKENRIEILAVGTKNSQDRELGFLERL